MSPELMWAAVHQTALVGSDRLPMPAEAATPVVSDESASAQALQAAFAAPAASAAHQLLRTSAVATVLARAGWQPDGRLGLPPSAVVPAAAELRRAPESAALLGMMQNVLREGPQELRLEMLTRLNDADMRLPNALLVDALEQGRQATVLRPALAAVLGERGRWLADLNPAWRYACGVQETADPEQIWEEGSLAQRVELLLGERAKDAAGARARLERSLKELPARERLALVETLRTGLGMEDEPLLERLLSDRSKDVRSQAAHALSCLPGSAHSQRVMGWMQALLHRDAKDRWRLTAPQEADKTWERDGVALQPDPHFRGGARAWLLQQMVALTPLHFWTDTLACTPQQVVQWGQGTDWKDALREGWAQALHHQQDLHWLDVVDSLGDDGLYAQLCLCLSPEQRDAFWLDRLRAAPKRLELLVAAMAQAQPAGQTLSPAVSTALLDVLHLLIATGNAPRAWRSQESGSVLAFCAHTLHADSLLRLASLWRVGPQEGCTAPSGEPRPPWPDEHVAVALERIAGQRMALHAQLRAAQAPQAGGAAPASLDS